MKRILSVEIGYVQSIVWNYPKPLRMIKSGTVYSDRDIYTLQTHLLQESYGSARSSVFSFWRKFLNEANTMEILSVFNEAVF